MIEYDYRSKYPMIDKWHFGKKMWAIKLKNGRFLEYCRGVPVLYNTRRQARKSANVYVAYKTPVRVLLAYK